MAPIERRIVELSSQDRHLLEKLTKAIEKLEPKKILTRQEMMNRQRALYGNPYPHRSEPGNVLVLGPELFLSEDEKVMSYKGQEYYKPCGEFVKDLPDGGQSFCVKIVDHFRSMEHEDIHGNIRTGFSD